MRIQANYTVLLSYMVFHFMHNPNTEQSIEDYRIHITIPPSMEDTGTSVSFTVDNVSTRCCIMHHRYSKCVGKRSNLLPLVLPTSMVGSIWSQPPNTSMSQQIFLISLTKMSISTLCSDLLKESCLSVMIV